MVMHTRRGGDIEVMGLMQGKIKGGKLLLQITYRHFLRYGFIWLACWRNRDTSQRWQWSKWVHVQPSGCMWKSQSTWKLCGMVSLTPRLWLLALGNRCRHANPLPETSRTMDRHRHWPQEDHVGRKGRSWLLQNFPRHIYRSVGETGKKRRVKQQHGARWQNVRLRASREQVLQAGALVFQEQVRLSDPRGSLERVLGADTFIKSSSEQQWISYEGNIEHSSQNGYGHEGPTRQEVAPDKERST